MSGLVNGFQPVALNKLQSQLARDPRPALERYWQERLGNQGAISTAKPTLGGKLENTISATLQSAGMANRHANRLANRAAGALTDLTPVGNVTGASDGIDNMVGGISHGSLGQAALGAGVFGLSMLPFAGAAKRKGGQVLSDVLRDEAGAIRAYHVSPHDFDKFSMDKLGTGEGAQAYGKGLYFATDRSGPTIPHYQKMFGPQSKTYEVDLDVAPSDLIDWDAPGWRQPENVQSLLRQHGMRTEAPVAKVRETKSGKFTALNTWDEAIGSFADKARAEAASLATLDRGEGTAGLLYSRMGGNLYYPHLDDGRAAQGFMDAGIKGGRWNNASNDENLVIFDDKLVNITGKY